MIRSKGKILLAAFLLSYGYGKAQIKKDLTLTFNADKTFQTIDNFAASDAWSCQFVGNWPQAKKDAIADWLFSTDTMANGNPKGIGLSMWRFNLGGGSTQQADASGIKDEWRRAESFLNEDGSYNWNRQAGQQWFLTAAKERGVKSFLAFYNSPPFQFTKNNKTFSRDSLCIIDSNQYKAFADYTCNAIQGVEKKTGVHFNYISPVNEPQWDWTDGGQEGSPYTNKEVSDLVRVLGKQLQQQKIQTNILVAEAGHIGYLLEEGDKQGRGNQVYDFMLPSSANYIGNVPMISKAISAHSYFSTSPYSASFPYRERIAQRLDSIKGASFWQSEYCILGDNNGEIDGSKRDLGMKAALYLARVIHVDLAVANAAAWQWWTAISAYDYKDGLIYIDKNKTEGNYYDSKMLWVLGNYSRFIRPGMQRIEVTPSAIDSSFFVSAYKDKQHKKTVVVIVNTGKDGHTVHVKDAAGRLERKRHGIITYTTSNDKKLAKQVVNETIAIEPESVTTVVVE